MRSANAQNFIFNNYAKSCIEFKARQLSRRSEFRGSDREDLQQEIWLVLLKESHRFNPLRSSLNTFVDRVVNSAVCMILRRPYRGKRAQKRKTLSLEQTQTVSDNEGKMSLAETISDADQSRRMGISQRNETVRRNAAEAFAHAVDTMPADMRDVCRQVMDGSISSAARELGMSRYQVRRALQAARPHFEQAGF